MELSDRGHSYKRELLSILRERYQQGLIPYCELAHQELIFQDLTDEEEYAAYIVRLQSEFEGNAAETGINDYQLSELLFLARLNLVRNRIWNNQ